MKLWSPVTSANWLTCSWVIRRHSVGPTLRPDVKRRIRYRGHAGRRSSPWSFVSLVLPELSGCLKYSPHRRCPRNGRGLSWFAALDRSRLDGAISGWLIIERGAARRVRSSHRRRRMSSRNENFALLRRRDLRTTARAARALSSRRRRRPLLWRARGAGRRLGSRAPRTGRGSRPQRRDLAAEQPGVRGRVPRDAAPRRDRRAAGRPPQTARGPRAARDRAAGGPGHDARARARARRRGAAGSGRRPDERRGGTRAPDRAGRAGRATTSPS